MNRLTGGIAGEMIVPSSWTRWARAADVYENDDGGDDGGRGVTKRRYQWGPSRSFTAESSADYKVPLV